jgi:hypothetical protein
MNLKRIQWEEVDWINVPQDRDDWWTVVNTVLNLGIHGVGDLLCSGIDKRNVRKKQLLLPTRVQSVTRQYLLKGYGSK